MNKCLLTLSLTFAIACWAAGNQASAEEAAAASVPPKILADDSGTITRQTPTFRQFVPGEEESPVVEEAPVRRIVPFEERERIHESITRQLHIRPTQARQDRERFWENYELGGQPEKLEQSITLRAEELPLKMVLEHLGETAELRFDVLPGVEEIVVTINAEELPLDEVLKQLFKSADVVPIYDRYEDSYVLVNLRQAPPISEVEDFRVPLVNSDPAGFLAMALEFGFDPGEGRVDIDREDQGFLYTGEVGPVREFRNLVRLLDRRPPPEGEQYVHRVVEVEHENPRVIMLDLWRNFHGNFLAEGNKLAILVTPRELDAVLERIAELNNPPVEE